ncbi:MAG: 2-oxoglutarate dehydrogenase E1 component [Candidatus Promineifilaceae bacterium]
MSIWDEFHGPNAGYVAELLERYHRDPAAVDDATRRFFEKWTAPEDGRLPAGADVAKITATVNLAAAIREYGHLAAQLDPLGRPPPGDPALTPAYHGLTEVELGRLPASLIGGPIAANSTDALQAIGGLGRVYSGRVGYDFDHLRQPEEREWLRDAVEGGRFRPPQAPFDRLALLKRLTEVETFEHFLHRIFPGRTRFSIEGLDMLVPILDVIMQAAAQADSCLVLIGMAHRGRLNVLAHNLGKPYAHILAEFKDPGGNLTRSEAIGYSGDVKYHAGKAFDFSEGNEVDLVALMAPNPSHLEHVNPVVLGMSRAADAVVDQPGPPHLHHQASLAILIHGDASFPAQGVVAESLNMSRLSGYTIGGAVHIITNNQLGFTTDPAEGRSTLYASDLAKGFKIPVIHVNADDVEGCIEVARLAAAYRARFLRDILIDLIGYRRYGHNEGDEPSFTQPLMYAQIDLQPSVRQQWAEQLVASGAAGAELPEQLRQEQFKKLEAALELVDTEDEQEAYLEPQLELPLPGLARHVETAVAIGRLRELNGALTTVPENFALHSKLERAYKRRRAALDNLDGPTVDWATAEELALATILVDGVAVRFTGEDAERGTFSQRHAIWHDVKEGRVHIPLQSLPQAAAAFEIHNSPLSEYAAIGFEYGYNVAFSGRLVIWEAQYGDFINAAQAMIDEFLVSGRAKWEQTPSLVLLLPHGYEGQGPDHSTGRPERFLQLAAETNLRLAYPSTAGQYFHLLRRQAALLRSDPLPLIVLTPKSLLRHPAAASTPRDLAEGSWRPVIPDPWAGQHPDQVRRLVLCSGKVYVDLVASERREQTPAVAIGRLEQLYRFPAEEVGATLDLYPGLKEVFWLQEEPQNMGAWTFVRDCLEEAIAGRWPLRYAGRPRRASPAEGSGSWHHVNQRAIVARAFALD